MTRGPQPLKAIVRAQGIAMQLGTVMDNRMLVQSRYSFMLFCPDRTVFVRVKRIRAHVSDPKEIILLFRTDVFQLRTLPKTPVISREIWTLSPWNVWQFFVVGDDRVTEVRYEFIPEVLPGKEIRSVMAKDPLPENQVLRGAVEEVLPSGKDMADVGSGRKPA